MSAKLFGYSCLSGEDMKKTILVLACLLVWIPSAFALTLGDTSGGASCDSSTDYFSVTFTSAESDDFTSVSINGAEFGTNGYDVAGGIWADTGSGTPGALLASGNNQELPDSGGDTCAGLTSSTYTTSTFSSVTITAQQLWIGGREATGGAINDMAVEYDSGANGYERGGVGSLTDPFGTGTARSGRQYSAYATYTVTPSGARRVILVN